MCKSGGMKMEDLSSAKVGSHKLSLVNRKTCMLSGVKDVLSFDVHEILLETDQGMLMIKGEDLHVSRLTLEKGDVDIEGKVDSLTYSDTTSTSAKAESFFGRLFK